MVLPVRAGLDQNRPVDTHPIHMLHVGVQGVAIREFRGVRPLPTPIGVQGITLLIRTEHVDVPLYDHGGILWLGMGSVLRLSLLAPDVHVTQAIGLSRYELPA